MVITKLANRECELEGILSLQGRNLKRHLNEAEAMEQGFLIAEYTLDYLRRMNDRLPAVISVEDDRVVGYALAVSREIGEDHSFLAALFAQIDALHYRHTSLAHADYVVVGQLCVDKAYRGMGLVRRMYGHFRESLEGRYQYGITDVARANRRSLKAHLTTGFQVIHSIEYDGLDWDIVLWDWTDRTQPE